MQHEILRRAVNLVLEHKEEIDKELFEGIYFRALEVRIGDDSKENLKKWFITAVGPGWRAGPPPKFEKRREVLRAFDEWYEYVKNKVLANYSGQDAINEMYKSLYRIDTIGPKIAGVLLRDWIYHFGIWSELKDFLYLPVDRHVRNLIINKLKACEETEVPRVSEDYFTKKNQIFQGELRKIHNPRVEFDYFWAIGSTFCSYNLCHVCWLSSLCRQREPIL